MIRVLALDVDGVLTNGEVVLDEAGRESKALFFRDIDAIFAARRKGLDVVLVTGEETPIVDAIARKLEIEHVYAGHRDKAAAVHGVSTALDVPLAQICYVGDAARDAPALELVGLGLAPADAAEEAKAAADRVLDRCGGRGCVEEALRIIFAGK